MPSLVCQSLLAFREVYLIQTVHQPYTSSLCNGFNIELLGHTQQASSYGFLWPSSPCRAGRTGPIFSTFWITKLEDHGESRQSRHSTIAAVPVEANLSGRSGCCCHRPDQRSKVSTYSTGPTWCPGCEKLNMKLQNMQRKRHPPDMRLRRYFRITVHFCLLEDSIQRHSIWFLVPSSWTWHSSKHIDSTVCSEGDGRTTWFVQVG